MPSNGKTYTEVLIEVYDKLDVVEQRMTKKLDTVIRDNSEFKAGLAKGEVKFDAIDDKIETACVALEKGIDKNGKRLDGHDDDFKAVNRNQKYLGLGEAVLTVLASWGVIAR